MKKVNPAKDYVIAAFRYWARVGCPSYEDVMTRITQHGHDSDAESAKIADILACVEVFRRLEESGRTVIRDAVCAVYMAEPHVKPTREVITARVLQFSREEYVSDRQVWRYLAEACVMLGELRGLRTDDDEV